MRPFFFKAVRFIIPLVIFIFLGRVLVEQWYLLENYSWNIDIPYLISSFIVLLFTFLLWALLFKQVFIHLGAHLSLRKTFKILYISNLGRYIPGKVWQFVGMYYLLERENIGRVKATSGIMWSNLFTNLSGVLVGAFIISLSKFDVSILSVSVLVLLFVCVFIVVQPKVIDHIVNYVLEKLNKDQIKVSLPMSSIVSFVLSYALVWLCLGAAFFMLTKSIADIDIHFLPVFIGFFAASYVIGYLSIVTPGGLGVREGVMTYMLSYYIPLPIATVIAVAARLWLTIGELACVAIALRIK